MSALFGITAGMIAGTRLSELQTSWSRTFHQSEVYWESMTGRQSFARSNRGIQGMIASSSPASSANRGDLLGFHGRLTSERLKKAKLTPSFERRANNDE